MTASLLALLIHSLIWTTPRYKLIDEWNTKMR
jgi:hypothetical protein